MITEVITENQIAKQDMNAMYLKSTGAKEQMSVIKFFATGTIFFQVCSALFSAFGFYFDFLDSLGVIAAVVIGLGLGAFIEAAKHYSLKGAFSKFEFYTKVLMGGLTFIMVTIALSYHYKSLNTFKNISVKQDLQEQVNFERKQLEVTNSNIAELIENNKELAKVLDNGKSGDDYYATQSILSSNELMGALTVLNGSSHASNLLLKQSEKTANQNSNTLLLLFITMEIFSIFGIISKIILARNTDENVKSVVTTMDKLNTLESNVYLATETVLIGNTEKKINAQLEQIKNSPALSYESTENYQNQPYVVKLPFYNHEALNPYLKGVANRLEEDSEKPLFLPVINKRNPTSKGTRTETEEFLKENLNDDYENIENDEENQENRVLDLMKFSNIENELIKIIWDNESLGKGDKLIPKRFVLEQLPQTATERDLINLYAKLEDSGAITFKNGYRANVSITNKVNTK